MPRQRRSDLEDWIDLAARLPWWLAVSLAAGSYLGLHALAETPLTPVKAIEGFSGSIAIAMLRTMAMVGQYLVPAVLILGALASAIAVFRRRKLFAQSKARAGTRDLHEMSWQDFERLVGQAFRERGYQVTEAPAGPDGGVDLTLLKHGELHLVQCKRWRAQKVGVEIVRELYGVMSARGAVGGYVVTSGEFTPEARRFAEGRNIELWNGDTLKAVIQGAQGAAPASSPMATSPSTTPAQIPAPACPSCGASMVERIAKRGPHTGQAFWGCSNYPSCRGMRPMAP